MMKLNQQIVVAGVVLWLVSHDAPAQTNLDATAQPKRTGQSVSPERLTVNDVSPTSSLRPARQERTSIPPEVKERMDRFKDAARAYLQQTEELKKQLQGANDKERAILREKVRQLREEWIEKAREFRKEFKTRQRELLDKLPDYREVIDSVRNAAQEQVQQAQPGGGPHRGQD
jgi:hypothetical protein